MDIKELIRQHGKSVAVVFRNMGINTPVTVKDVLLLTFLYKQDFINAVANQIDADDPYEHAEGPTKGEQTKQTLLAVLQGVLTGAGAYMGARQQQKQIGSTATPPFVYPGANNVDDSEKKKKDMHTYLLVGGIALIIILAIMVFHKK